ncbi:ABC transporter ATP-binding protein [Gorillibacterium timonense]|uniref:ABC transporter ATP-binding protein n=1 Tax=Gorillibacterium timonense TaxID=1689269 RepID=UPI00071D3727|nr:ABC transporter ATP-binding protein [Gorillibacterium timonense]
MSRILSLSRVAHSYSPGKSPPVFTGVSLELNQGEFVSLVGPSGTGKSTLFKLIAGLDEPTSGEIVMSDSPLPAADRLGKVGYMPQKDLLLPWRTVLANCLLASELSANAKSAYSSAQVRSLLERFGLGQVLHAYPDELSGGMRQRAAFLRTVATGRPLLLLDEPFGAIDALTKQDMHRWLLSLWADLGVSVLFITHDLEEALLLSDRICIMPTGTDKGLVEVPVTLPRPRSPSIRFEPAFVELRRELEGRLLG